MIEIIVDYSSPRINYACKLLFGNLLGQKWAVREKPSDNPTGPVIHYTQENPKDRDHIPCIGWLYENNLRHIEPGIEVKNVPLLFPYRKSRAVLKFDILAATFFLATEYHRYFQHPTDAHGRPDPKHAFVYHNGLHHQPLIHWYAQLLKDWLLELDPNLKFPSGKFDYEIAIDVDHPWRYLHRSLPVQAGGWFRDLISGRFGEASARINAALSKNDPYDLDQEILDLLPAEKTLFFFLIKRRSPQDNRFSLPHTKYQELIKLIQNQGYRVGIHPSYLSSETAGAIREEVEMLEKVVGKTIYSRQHFLKYTLPDTFTRLIESGIEHEYSLTPPHEPGFATGLATQYPWFNVARNQETELLLQPGIVMDRSLQQYMGMSPEAAEKTILKFAETVKRVNGKFVLNLHNETFSDTAEWKGWRTMLTRVLRKLEEWAQDESKLPAAP